MSTIWTPGGEHPVEGRGAAGDAGAGADAELSPEELEARMAQLRAQLADAPVETVVANHCFGLFELAALHLSLRPPRLPQAQLAIDALGALVEGLAGRLGEHEGPLRDGLAQLRLAYVQIKAGTGAAPPPPSA